ncbi:hypothetical protein [Streptomyces sp. OR43]|uniref:hypothetical protein n=1 Tax=Streptomyces sp. or43 TaxID=2478957 RepID=UPI0011CDE0A1|nr:hypothetical protein [Streptomyces sp. or43]TXS34158.1 hypothetical protein EAO72_41455 [Streptomyces sp. or43]
MNHIVTGQAVVTDSPLEPLEFGTLAGQDALRDIVEMLAAEAVTDVDDEDLAYYRGLLVVSAATIGRAPAELAVAA